MPNLTVKMDVPLSDVWMQTIFENSLESGYSGEWFQPAAYRVIERVEEGNPSWHCESSGRVVHNTEQVEGSEKIMGWALRVRCDTGKPAVDASSGWFVDHEGIRDAVQKIIEDTEERRKQIGHKGVGALGIRKMLIASILEDQGEVHIDAEIADCVLQVASFGEVIFS